MATLTETAYWTKRILAGLGLFFIVVIIFKLSLGFYRSYQESRRPPPPPTPAPLFGKLPKLILPTPEPEIRRPTTYAIETLTGTIPEGPPIGTVYFMPPRPGYTFFTSERAKDFARKFGFREEPVRTSGEEFFWEDPELPGRTFRMNIFTYNFEMKYATNSATFPKGTLMSKSQAENFARNFLAERRLLSDDLARGEATSRYLRLEGGTIQPVINITDANLIRVDFFRQGIEELPVLPERFDQSLVYFLISGSKDRKKQILELHYTHWPIDYENFATYPLKSGGEAYQELEQGGGTIVSGKNLTRGVIREVYLAYLETEIHQDYLQPVFIFKGDNEFVAYVPAIKEEWTE